MKKLTVAGIGAGNYEGLTVAAVRALEAADVIVGYTVYCDLMKPYFKDKTWISTPMMQEIERCRLALETAEEGKRTVMICSGDAGIYGMTSPVLELAEEYGAEVEIVAGVTAASSGAALLGSPLTADFAAISLSDLLTPWETIEKRLEAAASADLVTVLYNPASKKRTDYLRRACAIFLKYRPAETVCGVARNIGREGEEAEVLTLGELENFAADMFTTVFIGNAATKIIGGKMVTPRGYRHA
ncbi:MAG: precorrin-3B C(17)-methyltransferase [Clostridiales bacterium]|nr:precorrin-3B C(17)-methyltransferase [Clostridiales bacterium]